MSTESDVTSLVRSWLTEGATELPDRVLDSVLDQLPATPQRRTRWPVGTTRRVGVSARTALVAAALALVAVVGVSLLPRADRSIIGPGPTPSASPTPSSKPDTPAPTVSATATPSSRSPLARTTSGTAATAIGNVSWAAYQGDESNIPGGDIFETPTGFASIEPDMGLGARFWVSTDGVDWELRPFPVPGSGNFGHATAAGEHWMWAANDFRLWRSTDFATWTEVDLTAFDPPAIPGLDWSLLMYRHSAPATIGATTVVPWRVVGRLALAELLDIPLQPGEALTIEQSRHTPALGDVVDVFRIRAGQSPSSSPRAKVGAIRLELDGSIARVFDADRAVVVAEIDAELVGVAPDALAQDLNQYGSISIDGGGVAISAGVVRAISRPADLRFLVAAEDRFILMANRDLAGIDVVWASTDGIDWTSLGPPIGPSTTGSIGLELVSDGDQGQPFTAFVEINDRGNLRNELWSSTDGHHWVGLGETSRYLGLRPYPLKPPTLGYLATTDRDDGIHVSATGATWTVVDGLDGIRQSLDVRGGAFSISVTRKAIFMMELPIARERVLWIVRVG